ncbi:MAG: hypothetical protein ACK4PC_03465 [Sphingopyxis sp.]
MMTMIERAARAIETEIKRQAGDHGFFVPRDESDEGVVLFDGRIDPSDIARAVLLAIREPSEGMATDGLEAMRCGAGPVPIFTAMIDAALSEGG